MPDPHGLSVVGRVELRKLVLAAGDVLDYVVINSGDLPIMLRAAYVLERSDNGAWVVANSAAGFRAWGRRLPPGEQTQLTTRLAVSLPAGSYRLRKQLRADRDLHRGYEWLGQRDIAPCEAIEEFAVKDA